MGWLDKVKAWLGGGSGAEMVLPPTGSAADVAALLVDNTAGAHKLEAMAPALHQRGKARGEAHECPTCAAALEPVVFTTFGGPVWSDHPMAMDGWRCRGCGNLSGPAWLTAEEVQALEVAGGRAGQAGELDTAELMFRRILASWPGYPMASLNLASVYMDRLQVPDLPEETQARYRAVLEAEMRRAAQGEPVPHPFVFQTLARLCAFRGDEDEAWQFLEKLTADPRSGEPEHAAAEELHAYLDGLAWLYDRGTERLTGLLPTSHGAPVLDGQAVEEVTAAIVDLERFAVRHPEHWQARFFLGKAHEALGQLDPAVRWLTEALELDHHNPDVGRELAGVFLQAGRAQDAIYAARAALALAPENGGLHANLALSLLIAGEDREAAAAVGRALALDADDAVSARLKELIEAVARGERERPTRLRPGGKLDEGISQSD